MRKDKRWIIPNFFVLLTSEEASYLCGTRNDPPCDDPTLYVQYTPKDLILKIKQVIIGLVAIDTLRSKIQNIQNKWCYLRVSSKIFFATHS